MTAFWTPELVERAVELRKSGKTYSVIAREMGAETGACITSRSVQYQVSTVCPGLQGPRPRMQWSPERIQLLQELRDKGLNVRQIGVEMGMSRSTAEDAISRYCRPRTPKERKPEPPPPTPRIEALPVPQLDPGPVRALFRSEPRRCCWPGEQPCPNEPEGHGRPYCCDHAARAYVRRPAQLVASVYAFLVKYFGSANDGQSLREPLHTVTVRDRFGLVQAAALPIGGELHVIADVGMRMLTPRELYRAQGFPDSYQIDIPYKGKPLSKKAQIRMAGNSVCPPVARAIVAANYSRRYAALPQQAAE